MTTGAAGGPWERVKPEFCATLCKITTPDGSKPAKGTQGLRECKLRPTDHVWEDVRGFAQRQHHGLKENAQKGNALSLMSR